MLPHFPELSVGFSIQFFGRWQGLQDLAQFLLEPGVQDRVGAAGHAIDPDFSSSGMKKCQQLSRSVPNVFMGLTLWFSFWLPT